LHEDSSASAPGADVNAKVHSPYANLFLVCVPGYNLSMRLGVLFSAVLALAAFGFCADQPDTLLLPCPQGSPAAPGCNPSKNELRDARNASATCLKLQREKRLDEAFEQFETAARIAPRDVEYVTAKEMARQQLVFDHLARGNTELA